MSSRVKRLGLLAAVAAAVLLTACPASTEPGDTECGNGIVEPGEQCDLGPFNNDLAPDACRRTCVYARCGDGVTDTGEECDDGNTVSNDGCSSTCVRERRCGDGVVDAPEQCDDGNTLDGDGCAANCQWEFECGDGVCETDRNESCMVCAEDCCPCGDGVCESLKGETCARCREDCCPSCGDGVLGSTEQCDDGNNADGDGCAADCKDEDGVPTCGNGIWEAGEACDDGNTTDLDGCSATCQREFVCGDGTCESAMGESCELCHQDCCPSCGNGVKDAGEACDGAALGGATCEALCYPGGTPSCTAYCTLDVSTCTGSLPVCGDGVVDCGEECDQGELGGLSCSALGYEGGTLGCTSACFLDLQGCGALLQLYEEGFEGGCPAGWTLGGDWQCGVPTSGPGSARTGSTALATVLAGNYSNSQAWATAVADSPPIDLSLADRARLRLWMWIHTEGSSFDGANLKISTNGGTSYSLLTPLSPAYNLTVDGQSAWGGDLSALGWQQVLVDLAPYVGHTVILRLAFRSDSSITYAGVYVDDLEVLNGPGAPLAITTASPLPDVLVGDAFLQTLGRTGGSTAARWSLTGGTNHGWLALDPVTGMLSGTPGAGALGPVSVTIRVEEPSYAANFAEKTFTFSVRQVIWTERFDAGCPAGWTLAGDWQCGAPSSGPNAARSAPNCLATQLAGSYSNNQAWDTAVADSPPIDLGGLNAPVLSFWMWIYTEGSSFDGANLKISRNGGSTFTLVTPLSPPYGLTVDGQSAWGGNLSSSGWQQVLVDLEEHVNRTVILRLAFRTDGSGVYPGVYVDDLMIADY